MEGFIEKTDPLRKIAIMATTRKRPGFRICAACLILGLSWSGACVSQLPSEGEQAVERAEAPAVETEEAKGVDETGDTATENSPELPARNTPEVSIDGMPTTILAPAEESSVGLLEPHSSLLTQPTIMETSAPVHAVEVSPVLDIDSLLVGDPRLPSAGGPQQPGLGGLRSLDGEDIIFSQILPTPSLTPWPTVKDRDEKPADKEEARHDEKSEEIVPEFVAEESFCEPMMSEQQVVPFYPVVPVITTKSGMCGKNHRTTVTPYVLIPPGQAVWGAAPYYGGQVPMAPAFIPGTVPSYTPQAAYPAPVPYGLPYTTSYIPVPPITSVPGPTPPGTLAKYPFRHGFAGRRPHAGFQGPTAVIQTTTIPLPPTITVTPPQIYWIP